MFIDYLSAGDRHRPLLLLLHGIGGGAECFKPQLQAFSGEFYTVAWNMPGYGGSDPLATVTFQALSDSVTALLNQLGNRKAHVVGHSIGGMVAQQFIADHPERVESLTLVATSAAFGSRDGDFQRRFLEERLGPLDRGSTMKQLADSIIDSLIGSGPDRDMMEIARECMARVPESGYRANMECLVTFDLRKELGNIGVPTLVIAGEKDKNAPPAVMEKMASFIPNAEFHCVNQAGHLVNLEQPAAFNALLGDFLKSVTYKTHNCDEQKNSR